MLIRFTRFHSIVGIGNHSADHVSKLRPCVENICRRRGLVYSTPADNLGRLHVDLTPAGRRHYHQAQHDANANAGATTYTQNFEYDPKRHQPSHAKAHGKKKKRTEKEKEKENENGKKIPDWKRLKCFCCSMM